MIGNKSIFSITSYIPSLVAIRASLKHEHTKYALDWDHVDQNKNKEFARWAGETAVKPLATLPEPYNTLVKSLTYNIPDNYRKEINHQCMLFISERMRERPFDTVIRDMCASVSRAAINCAFKLLTDCIIDKNTNGWFRYERLPNEVNVNKWMIQSLLIYKFWRGMAGNGLVYEFAEMDKLEKHANIISPSKSCLNTIDNIETAHSINVMLRDIKKWEVKLEQEQNEIKAARGSAMKDGPHVKNIKSYAPAKQMTEGHGYTKTKKQSGKSMAKQGMAPWLPHYHALVEAITANKRKINTIGDVSKVLVEIGCHNTENKGFLAAVYDTPVPYPAKYHIGCALSELFISKLDVTHNNIINILYSHITDKDLLSERYAETDEEVYAPPDNEDGIPPDEDESGYNGADDSPDCEDESAGDDYNGAPDYNDMSEE